MVRVSVPLSVRSVPSIAVPVPPRPSVRSCRELPLPVANLNAPVRLLPVLMTKLDEEDPVIVPVPDAERSAPEPSVRV